MTALTQQELVTSILSMPNAPIILEEVGQQLVEERKKRLDFYDKVTDENKVEFINGEVIVHSPVKKAHNDITGLLHSVLDIYVRKNKLGYVGYEKLMISLTRNDYEPDICFFDKSKSNQFTKDQSRFPAPDLVIEVLSKDTAQRDRGIKYQDYEAHHVAEYWIIVPKQEVVEQYRLNEEGSYELILKSGTGIIECACVQGFTIPVRAIFDEVANMEVLEKMFE